MAGLPTRNLPQRVFIVWKGARPSLTCMLRSVSTNTPRTMTISGMATGTSRRWA